GDGHISRVDAEERAQGLWQGLYRRYDLHPRNAGGRDAPRRRSGRHGYAVVCRLRHLRSQGHRARRYEHHLGQLSGWSARLCSEHVFRSERSPITSTQDLKGKKVGINAFGSAVDLALRVKLKKDGIDPRKDLTIVEVAFP